MSYRIECPKCKKENFRIHYSDCLAKVQGELYKEKVPFYIIGVELECDNCHATSLSTDFDIGIANDVGDGERAKEMKPFKKGRWLMCFVEENQEGKDNGKR